MKFSQKVKKNISLLIKSIIFIIVIVYIYRQLFTNRTNDFAEILSFNQNIFSNGNTILVFVLLFVLMGLNWSIEVVKWKYLIRKIENVSFFKSLTGVLSGIAICIFTPNRIGEYMGRVFVLETADRIKGVLITVIGSISLWLIYVIIGTISLIVYFFNFENTIMQYLSVQGFWILLTLLVLICLMLVYFFFNISLLNRIFGNTKWQAKIKEYLEVFSYYKTRELSTVLLLSFVRYCIFCFQFYLLLNLFGVNIPLMHAMMMIAIIYFVPMLFPSFVLSEIGMKCSIALYLFQHYFNTNTTLLNDSVMSATLFIWIINVAIPALIGCFFLFKLKFFRKIKE